MTSAISPAIPWQQALAPFSLISGRVNPPKLGPFLLNRCHQADSIYALREIGDETVDLVVADPPFAINFTSRRQNYNRDAAHVLLGYVEVKYDSYRRFCELWIQECKRILKKTSVLAIISGWSNQGDILNAVAKAGLKVVNQLIFKFQFGPFTTRQWVSSHYNIFICPKRLGEYTFQKLLWYPEDVMQVRGDMPVELLEIPREYWPHQDKPPTKLPKELIELLVNCYSHPKDIVVDPFAGAGTTLKVCSYMNRDCATFEIVPAYVDFCNERVKQTRWE